jgi:hypothetical protein
MEEILKKLEDQENKINAIYISVEKTRRYFLWTLIATIVAFVLPLLGIVLVIPWFLKTMSAAYGGLL